MESLRQIGIGILLAAISITVILGGFTLATAEGNLSKGLPVVTETIQALLQPTNSPTDLPSTEFFPTQPLPTFPVGTVTPRSSMTIAATNTTFSTRTLMPSVTATIMSTSTPFPSATRIPTSTVGLVATIPVVTARASATTVACGAPYGWINYYVVSGDTLFGIGTRYGVSVYQLQQANCLGSSVNIQVGTIVKVPNVATITPLVIPTAIQIQPSVPPTATAEPPTNTSLPPTAIPTLDLPTAIPTAYGGLGGG